MGNRPGYQAPARATGEVYELRKDGAQAGVVVLEHGYVKRAAGENRDIIGFRWTEAVNHLRKRGYEFTKLFHERKTGKPRPS